MKGFTLLEVLIATALSAVILMAVYGAYSSNMETIQRARESSQLYQTVRIVFDMMKKDLQCAFGEEMTGVTGENKEMDGKPADVLRVFTTANHAGAGDVNTGLYRVVYEMLKDQTGEGYVLNRTQEAMVGAEVSADKQTFELTRMVSGLDLHFQDAKGDLFESWSGQKGEHAGKLPSLVQVRMTLKGPSGRERVFTTAVHPEIAGFQDDGNKGL